MFSIPDYKLIQKCGEGAYGEVWLAEGCSGKKVAAKIIHDEKLAEKEFEGLRKTETLSPSDFRIQIFHVGKAGGRLYYIMERADDLGSTEYQPATLAAKLKEGRMKAPEVIALGLRLLAGIAEFHAAHLYHRDIKPENIIYVDGKPKLSDIGLVCSGKEFRKSAGTPGFIPPEKSGNPDAVSNASDDLYALGMVLYCCWTGNSPEKYPQVPAECLNDENAKIINAVIGKAAAKEADQRYKSAEQFRKHLSAGSSKTLWQKFQSVMNLIAKQTGVKKSICTVRPAKSAFFVGRQIELEKLQKLCNEGSFPIIQGEGGIGKTELAVAYAYDHDAEYSEGRFMIRMEHKRNWQEAVCSLLEEEEVIADLHLSDAMTEKDKKEQHIEIIAALFRKTERGKLLLFLDNVDDLSLFQERNLLEFSLEKPIPANLHIIATTRQNVKFGLSPRVKGFPLENLDDHAAFELFCNIGNNQFPFCNRHSIDNNPEYIALMEIIRLLDGHVWALEILAGYMAEHYQEGMTFRKELKQLQKQFSVQGKTSYRHKADDGAALLGPTFEMIKEKALGNVILELAEIAAFFPPDEIPAEILSAYWKQYFSDLIYEDGKPFEYALNTLKKFYLLKGDDHILKMHRLTREVLNGKISAEKPSFLRKLAKVLESCPTFTDHNWFKFFHTVPEIFEYISNDYRDLMFPARCWIWLFLIPGLRKFCPWEKLKLSQQCHILERYPQYMDMVDLSKFTSSDWSDLLSTRPQFGNQCHIFDQFTAEDWSRLLRNQPQFENQCHIFNQFSIQDWAIILENQPQFFKYLPPDCQDADIWFTLLPKDPSMAARCPWDKIQATAEEWSLLLFHCPTLAVHPDFLKHCPWSSFNGQDWGQIPREHSELFSVYCNFNEFMSCDWNEFLKNYPEYEDRCPWDKIDFSSRDWLNLILAQPRFIKYIPTECMNTEIWLYLLEYNYEYKEPCPWDTLKQQLDAFQWGVLLKRRPEYENQCPFKIFNGHQWGLLLHYAPEMIKHFSGTNFTGEDWADVLIEMPQLSQHVHWDTIRMSPNAWMRLLNSNLYFIKYFPMDDITDAAPWFAILGACKDYDNRCPWDKLKVRISLQWGVLLEKRPDLIDKCPWKTFKTGDWIRLLRRYPQFANQCPIYDQLTDENWMSLLKRQPQLAVYRKQNIK